MIIYGVALLATCLVTGMIAGEYLGVAVGVEANVGGVGLAMLLLVVACNVGRFKLPVDGPSGEGIKFWSAMYIPIVVAMAARQNVVAAVDGGLLAIVAGVAAVISFALVPVLSRMSGVAGGLAATDPRLVPYGGMTATFYTGLGCLLGPSVLFLTVAALF